MDKLVAHFLQQGFRPNQPCQARRRISVSEKGQTYVLELPEPKKSAVYQVDGYMITAGDKCDAFVAIEAGQPNHSSKGAVVPDIRGTERKECFTWHQTTETNHHPRLV